MKKGCLILLAAAMVLSLCACGNGAGETSANGGAGKQEDEYAQVRQALLSDGGQWGRYNPPEGDGGGESLCYLTFGEDGTFHRIYYVPGSDPYSPIPAELDTSDEYEYEIDTEEDVIYYASSVNPRVEIQYTYEEGELSLVYAGGPLFHTDWNAIADDVLEHGFYAVLEYDVAG